MWAMRLAKQLLLLASLLNGCRCVHAGQAGSLQAAHAGRAGRQLGSGLARSCAERQRGTGTPEWAAAATKACSTAAVPVHLHCHHMQGAAPCPAKHFTHLKSVPCSSRGTAPCTTSKK